MGVSDSTSPDMVAKPGTYVIRALAHDGGLFSSQDVTVVVSK